LKLNINNLNMHQSIAPDLRFPLAVSDACETELDAECAYIQSG